MIDIIKKLENKGLAYSVDGDVYYAVDKFPGYGKLSGRTLEDMQAGARVDVDERKRNPLDFALWKKAKPGEPFWESPWGQGRPGWHIECSAMSLKYLGPGFDIHGGGEIWYSRTMKMKLPNRKAAWTANNLPGIGCITPLSQSIRRKCPNLWATFSW
jgi:hypothetical protein